MYFVFFSLSNKRLHSLQGRYSQPTKIPLWDASCGDCEYLSQKYNTIATIRAKKKRKRKFYNNIITMIDKKKTYTKKGKWYALHEGDKFNHTNASKLVNRPDFRI